MIQSKLMFILGYYIYLDNSLGEEGHQSLLWFYVDLSDEPEPSSYTFMYHMYGDGVGSLETFYRNDLTGYSPISVLPIYDDDIWVDSNCYSLPVGFKGEIYFRATRGSTVYGDISLDNVKITQENCLGI